MRKNGVGVLQRISDFKARRLDGRQRDLRVILDYWAFSVFPPYL